MTTQSTSSTPQEAIPLSRLGARFGRSVTWGYRLKYAGLIQVLTIMGSAYVTRAEIDRLIREGDGALPRRGRPPKRPFL